MEVTAESRARPADIEAIQAALKSTIDQSLVPLLQTLLDHMITEKQSTVRPASSGTEYHNAVEAFDEVVPQEQNFVQPMSFLSMSDSSVSKTFRHSWDVTGQYNIAERRQELIEEQKECVKDIEYTTEGTQVVKDDRTMASNLALPDEVSALLKDLRDDAQARDQDLKAVLSLLNDHLSNQIKVLLDLQQSTRSSSMKQRVKYGPRQFVSKHSSCIFNCFRKRTNKVLGRSDRKLLKSVQNIENILMKHTNCHPDRTPSPAEKEIEHFLQHLTEQQRQ